MSTDPQKWLLAQIDDELKEFGKQGSKRTWPQNWIVATNIEASGVPNTGAFDRAKELVGAARPALQQYFHIWGRAKIVDFLNKYPHIARRFGHFLTPGHILDEMYHNFRDGRASIETILYYLIVKNFKDQRFTKLEQAGSQGEVRPEIHDLFIDLPFYVKELDITGMALRNLTLTSSISHRVETKINIEDPPWCIWRRHPKGSRVWFVRGGPGQGKSTLGQYFCQIHRAVLILDQAPAKLNVMYTVSVTANEVKNAACAAGYWPSSPRVPVHVELKDFAQWYGRAGTESSRGVLSYLAHRLKIGVEQEVHVGTLKRAFQSSSWFTVFDGLDEVPHDVKEDVAKEVTHFVNGVAPELDSDLLTLCTSRPQGYSGQFSELESSVIDLTPLRIEQALKCARPVVSFSRSKEESAKAISILEAASESRAVQELMTTPLQSHILAIIVRDGERPPDRRWKLYDRFYDVTRRRESNKSLPDPLLSKMLSTDVKLLKTLHSRVGFALHASAETSAGAETSLEQSAFKSIASLAVAQMVDNGVQEKIALLEKATTERLVLLNTPADSKHIRFDIRQLQEFFASEFLYEDVDVGEIRERIVTIAGDAHWREVMHFLISALVENDRTTELSIAIEELNRLNAGDGDSGSGEFILSRRMGRGAFIVSRILQEGVLEQDKSIRQRFRECLVPMASFCQTYRLRYLLDVRQENSKHWLLNFLLDQLRVLAPAENIGASLVLVALLPDAHPRAQEFVSYLHRSDRRYLSMVLTTRSQLRLERDESDVQGWLRDFVVALLRSSDWYELGSEGLFACFMLIRDAPLASPEAASGGSAQYLNRLAELLSATWSNQADDATASVDIGNVRLSRRLYLSEVESFEFAKKFEGIADFVSEFTGLLYVVARISRCRMNDFGESCRN